MEMQLNSCLVRSWQLGDADAIARHANNHKIWLNLRDPFPFLHDPGRARVHPCARAHARRRRRSRSRSMEKRSAASVRAASRRRARVGGNRLLARRAVLGPGHRDRGAGRPDAVRDRDPRAHAPVRAAVRVERRSCRVLEKAGYSRSAAPPQRDQGRRRSPISCSTRSRRPRGVQGLGIERFSIVS